MKLRHRRMVAMKRKQTRRIGPRCSEFEPSCIVCACYHHLDTYGYYPQGFRAAWEYQEKLELLK